MKPPPHEHAGRLIIECALLTVAFGTGLDAATPVPKASIQKAALILKASRQA